MNITTRLLRTSLCVGFALFVSAEAHATLITWTGAQNTNYSSPNNWNPATVPTAGDDVVIPAGPTNQPTVDATGSALSLTINLGATLTLVSQSVLNVGGNITDNGSFGGLGALAMVGTVAQTIGGTGGGLGNGATGPININDLMVMNTAGVTLNHSMTIQRQLALNGPLTTTTPTAASTVNVLTLLSNAIGTAYVINGADGTTVNGPGGTAPTNANPGTYVVNGFVTVQRYIDPFLNPGLGYRHYSSPVANSTVADLTAPGFTPEVSAGAMYNSSANPRATTPFPTVYEYDQTRVVNTGINYFNGTSNIDRGYRVPTAGLTNPLEVARGYAVNISSTPVVDFVGTLNNGFYTRTLASNGTGAAADLAVSGWHLLGNPYPAPLDFSVIAPPPGTATPDLTGIDAAVYVVQSTSQYGNVYRNYMSNVNVINPIIPVAQGFYVHVSTPGTTGTINFRNSQRRITTDNTPFQRTTAITHPQVNFTLRSAATTVFDDVLSVYFDNGSTSGVDPRYDAIKLPNSTGLNMTTLASDGTALAIDGRPVPTGQLTIPMQVFVPTTGTYSLEASQFLNMSGYYTYLRDIQLGTLTDLGQTPLYTFTQNATNFTPRFELVFSSRALASAPATLTQQVSVYPNPAHSMVSVELPASLGRQALTATLTDAMGRTVRTNTLSAQGTAAHNISLNGLAVGVYSLQLRTDAGLIVKRIVIE